MKMIKKEKISILDSVMFMEIMQGFATPGKATKDELSEVLKVVKPIIEKRIKNGENDEKHN